MVQSSVALSSLLPCHPTTSSVLPSTLQWELGISLHPLHLLSLLSPRPQLSLLRLPLFSRLPRPRTRCTPRVECSTTHRLCLGPKEVTRVTRREREVGALSTATSIKVFMHHNLWSPMGVGVGCHTMQIESKIVHWLLYTLWKKPTNRYLLQLRPCQFLLHRLVSCRVKVQSLLAPSLPLILSPTDTLG